MNITYPDYDKNLVNVVCSIQRYYNIKTNHKSLRLLDDILEQKQPKNVVLMLFDGFGYNIIKRNKKACPFLNKNLQGYVTSTFPSTTMAARTTVESGLTPYEHGWLGWDMYFKDLNEVVTLTTNKLKDTNKKAADYNVARTLLNYESIVDKVKKQQGCTGNKITVYSNHKNESLFKMRYKIRKLLKNKKQNYIYAYYNEPDHIMHKTGTNSTESLKYFKKIDNHFRKLCNSLKNTIIIAVADHGHINNDYITLTDYPEIIDKLIGITSLDSRSTSFRVKKEYKKEFPMILKKVLKQDFIIKSQNDVIKDKLFGEGKENKYFKDGIGDYIAIGISDKSIRYSNISHKHVSCHSGLTEDEMLVPLIIVSK